MARALTVTPNRLLRLGVDGAAQTRKSDLLDRLSSADRKTMGLIRRSRSEDSRYFAISSLSAFVATITV